MKLIDLHCDTICKLMDQDKKGSLMENDCSIRIPAMRQAGTKAQFFACFTCAEAFENRGGYDGAYEHVAEMTAFLKKQTALFADDISLATSYKEMEENERHGRISAFLTVEESGILNGNMERLENLYRQGVRLMTLMWNYENCLGYPNSREPSVMRRGLNPFGVEVVQRMNELGVLIDVSHASDGVFWDVLEYSRMPVMASHSNCRELCSHPRNLSDEMIRALADEGGIAGLNFYGPFLGTEDESRIEEMTRHILHMLDIGGSEFPAIGTDFDGFDGMTRMEIPDAGKMGLLWDALKKRGVSERQLDKIWGENAERLCRQILQ